MWAMQYFVSNNPSDKSGTERTFFSVFKVFIGTGEGSPSGNERFTEAGLACCVGIGVGLAVACERSVRVERGLGGAVVETVRSAGLDLGAARRFPTFAPLICGGGQERMRARGKRGIDYTIYIQGDGWSGLYSKGP